MTEAEDYLIIEGAKVQAELIKHLEEMLDDVRKINFEKLSEQSGFTGNFDMFRKLSANVGIGRLVTMLLARLSEEKNVEV